MEALVGLALGYLGIFLAVMAAVGSAIGTGIAGEAASGVVTEEPTRFVPALVLQALPGTQGIYGFVVGFLLLGKLDVIDTVAHGWLFVLSGLPVFLGGLISAIYQGRVAAAAINMVAKRPEELAKGIIFAVVVEFYAILSFLGSFLLYQRI
ncbi:MAG TPA: V-type ATP synthase subunit K [Firmicutes bacterium]|jgi:V/A-type H+-transporting ATPase subunit K|nr:V-type ATP synthase subunit K [Bacillota bacterium]